MDRSGAGYICQAQSGRGCCSNWEMRSCRSEALVQCREQNLVSRDVMPEEPVRYRGMAWMLGIERAPIQNVCPDLWVWRIAMLVVVTTLTEGKTLKLVYEAESSLCRCHRASDLKRGLVFLLAQKDAGLDCWGMYCWNQAFSIIPLSLGLLILRQHQSWERGGGARGESLQTQPVFLDWIKISWISHHLDPTANVC